MKMCVITSQSKLDNPKKERIKIKIHNTPSVLTVLILSGSIPNDFSLISSAIFFGLLILEFGDETASRNKIKKY